MLAGQEALHPCKVTSETDVDTEIRKKKEQEWVRDAPSDSSVVAIQHSGAIYSCFSLIPARRGRGHKILF